MKNRTETPFVLPPINQTGIIVRDAEKISRHYSSTFGIGPFTTHDMDLARATLNGEPAPTKLRMVIAQMGPMEIELIQVLDGGDFYTGFLKQHGEGLHHLGSYVDDPDSYDNILAELSEQGIKPTFQYRGRSLRFSYLDTRANGGVILELICLARQDQGS